MGISQSFQDTFGKNQTFISATLTLRLNGVVNLRQLAKLMIQCGNKTVGLRSKHLKGVNEAGSCSEQCQRATMVTVSLVSADLGES